MSRFLVHRRGRAVLGLLLLGALCAGGAWGQYSFEPSFLGGGGYEWRNDNDSETGSFLGVGVNLPLRRTTPTSSLSFALGAAYRDRQSGSDNLSYRLGFGYLKRLSPRDTLNVAFAASQTDRPPVLGEDASDPSFIGGQERRDANASLGYRRAVGPRLGLGAQLGLRGSDFLPLETGGSASEERSQAALSANVDWALSPRDTIASSYSVSYYRFEESGDQQSYSLGVSYSRLDVGRFVFSASLGGWILDKSEVEPGAEEVSRGGSFLVSSSMNLQRVRLGAFASHGLDAGGAVGTVTTLTNISLTMSGSPGAGRLGWSTSAGWSRRTDPFDSGLGSLDTANVGASGGYRLGRKLSLQSRASWNKDLSSSDLRSDYAQIELGLSWSPFGSREFGPLGRIREDPTVPALGE